MTDSRSRDPHGSVPSAVDGARPSEPFADVAETTSGVVFFVGDRAYEMKKPVSLGFLDFSRREAREAACHREVELNRRLAPDVYLGVAEVRGPDGLGEHLVVMRRLPSASRLSSIVTAGVPVDRHLRRLAEVTAAFHARADRSPEIDATASRDATLRRWETNASRMSHLVGTLFEPALADRVLLLARRYLDGREPLFSGRTSAGHVCDGHGDLLVDDVFCLEDGPRVLDCLDFDDELRYGDVLADVAFMAMDLESLGRPDLADAFLGHYRRSSGARAARPGPSPSLTTTSPTGPRCAPSSSASAPSRVARPPASPVATSSSWQPSAWSVGGSAWLSSVDSRARGSRSSPQRSAAPSGPRCSTRTSSASDSPVSSRANRQRRDSARASTQRR